MKQDYFRQWMRLSVNVIVVFWFDRLEEDTLEIRATALFEEVCQAMQNNFFDSTVKVLKEQENDEKYFVYNLHEFYRSWEFHVGFTNLPDRLVDSHTGCVMFYLSLVWLHSSWIKDALFEI